MNLAVLPREIRVRLRSGDGRSLVSAEVNGEAVDVMAGDVIQVPARSNAKYRIVGRFQ